MGGNSSALRGEVLYIAPCMKKLRTYNDVQKVSSTPNVARNVLNTLKRNFLISDPIVLKNEEAISNFEKFPCDCHLYMLKKPRPVLCLPQKALVSGKELRKRA